MWISVDIGASEHSYNDIYNFTPKNNGRKRLEQSRVYGKHRENNE